MEEFKMKKMKKILAVMLALFLSIEGTSIKYIEADEDTVICDSDLENDEQLSIITFIKNQIDTWGSIPKFKKIYRTAGINGENILFFYDLKGNIISEKIGDSWTSFLYDSNNNMISVKTKEHIMNFEYVDNELKGFSYDNETYSYKICDCNVYMLIDNNENEVAKYEYLEDGRQIVYGKNEDGEWIQNLDSDFIGNINPMRLLGSYYDKYLDWYYVNGYFYDDKINNYVNEQNDLTKYTEKLEEIVLEFENMIPQTYDDSLKEYIRKQAIKRYNEMINDTNVGKPITKGSNWYASLSTTELVARIIYGENSDRYEDENAIAIVMANRLCTGFPSYKSDYYNYDIRNVVTKESQFSALIPGNSQSKAPNVNDNTWDYCLTFACFLCLTQEICDSSSYYTNVIDLIGKPYGIGGQNSFYDLQTAVNGHMLSEKCGAVWFKTDDREREMYLMAISGLYAKIDSLGFLSDLRIKGKEYLYNMYYYIYPYTYK